MPGADGHVHTRLSVVTHAAGDKALQHEGSTLPSGLCQETETLAELLETDGEATLPLPADQFQAWLTFAADDDAPTAAPSHDAESFARLGRLIEMSQFMRNAAAESRAASHVAKELRRAYRHDLLQSTARDTTHPAFPNTVPQHRGPQLLAAIALLPELQPPAVAAVAHHLTLCEALLLPPPFPAEALAHTLSLTAGVLDLSPPRVPAHNPAALRRITSTLAPLLAAGPPLQALRIPAPCLTSLQPLRPLLRHLNTLTSLCITHGKVTYSDLKVPGALDPRIVAAALERLSPATLRHLAIDPLCDPNADPVHRLLCSFTALTSLRLSNLPLALRHMPALASLTVTHLPYPRPAHRYNAPTATAPGQPSLLAAPSLEHVHISGSDEAVRRVYAEFSGHTHGLHIPPGSRAVFPGRPDSSSAPNPVDCCGYPVTPGGVSLHARPGQPTNVASSYSHALHFPVVRDAWAPSTTRTSASHQPGPASGAQEAVAGNMHVGAAHSVPACLTALALVTDLYHRQSGFAIARRVLDGSVVHRLRELWAGCMEDVPPRSTLREHSDPEDGSSFDISTGVRSYRDRHGCGWVTARPAGVAHPLCALEMLHYNSAPHSHGDCGTPGLHTLHLSKNFFRDLEDLVAAGAPCFMRLRDLGILKGSHPELEMYRLRSRPLVTYPVFRLPCLSHLTHLRTLSLQGVPAVCSAHLRVQFPVGLTALLLHGTDDRHAGPHMAGLGAALLRLRQLQCLDVDADIIEHRIYGRTENELVTQREAVTLVLEEVVPALRRALWEGLRPALLELPLHLGASVTVHT